MSNSGLITRMEEVLAKYEAGHLSTEEVERRLLFHLEGIEGVGLAAIHQARDLAYRLVTAHTFDGAEEFIDAKGISGVLSELREFLRSLPSGIEA